ncbi:MAG: hypothetical protein ACYCSQ_10360 [bacterium]
MFTVTKEAIKNIFYANLFYEIHKTEEIISLLKKKYGKNFEEFEKDAKSGKEKFEIWDDYIEWKAYKKTLEKLKKDEKDLDSGNIRLPQ